MGEKMSEKKIKLLKNKFREYCLDKGHSTASEKFNKMRKLKRLIANGVDEDKAIKTVAEMK